MPKNPATSYQHDEQALLRPEAGAQKQFSNNKPSKTYRYDSSLAPELCWDESTAAAEADESKAAAKAKANESTATAKANELLQKIRNAKTIEEAQTAAAQLQNMQKPFLNWTGESGA